eukprot:5540291-Pleurochrysis_carterae.AAC.1
MENPPQKRIAGCIVHTADESYTICRYNSSIIIAPARPAAALRTIFLAVLEPCSQLLLLITKNPRRPFRCCLALFPAQALFCRQPVGLVVDVDPVAHRWQRPQVGQRLLHGALLCIRRAVGYVNHVHEHVAVHRLLQSRIEAADKACEQHV